MDLNYQASFDAAELHKDERLEEMKEKIIFESLAWDPVRGTQQHAEAAVLAWFLCRCDVQKARTIVC